MNQTGQHDRVTISGESLDPAAALDEVGSDHAGAKLLFVGTARDHSDGKTEISHLEYEAYLEQVEAKIAEVVAEARGRWPIIRSVVEHRVGIVKLGEPSVVVAVSSGHREDAFAAGRYIIDELKARAPIWKKEHWPGGAEWVAGA